MLTLDRCIELAEEVVAERGENFRYCDPREGEPCRYIGPDDPRWDSNWIAPNPTCGCIVGEILKKADLLTNEIATCGVPVGVLIENAYIPVASSERSDVRQFLTSLQVAQDHGARWIVCLETAKAKCAR